MGARNWSLESSSARSNRSAALLLLDTLLDENRREKTDERNTKREDAQTVQDIPPSVGLACLLSKRTRRKAHHPIVDRYKNENGDENDGRPDRDRCD